MSKDNLSAGLEQMSKASNYNRWLFDIALPYLKGEILEVGCGIGTFTRLLIDITDKISCIEPLKEYVEIVKKELNIKNIFIGDIADLTTFWNNKPYDSVICFNVLEHIKDDERALKNMYQILNQDGHLIIITPAHQTFYNSLDYHSGHHRRYSLQPLVRKCEKIGFKVVKARYHNMTGAFGWFFNGKILKRQVISGNHLGLYDKFVPFLRLLESFFSPPFGLSVLLIMKKN